MQRLSWVSGWDLNAITSVLTTVEENLIHTGDHIYTEEMMM